MNLVLEVECLRASSFTSFTRTASNAVRVGLYKVFQIKIFILLAEDNSYTVVKQPLFSRNSFLKKEQTTTARREDTTLPGLISLGRFVNPAFSQSPFLFVYCLNEERPEAETTTILFLHKQENSIFIRTLYTTPPFVGQEWLLIVATIRSSEVRGHTIILIPRSFAQLIKLAMAQLIYVYDRFRQECNFTIRLSLIISKAFA